MTSFEKVDYFPWDDIQEGNVFPGGIYLMEITEIIDGETMGGKRMPKGRFKCVEPKMYAGKMYFDQYVVGTDEDMTGFVAGSFGSQALKAIFKAAQVPKANSFEELMHNSMGNQLLIHLSAPYSDDYGLKNKVIAYYKVGDREVGVQEAAKGSTPSGGGKSNAKMPPTAVKKATVPCGTCGKQIPANEYNDHIDSCEG